MTANERRAVTSLSLLYVFRMLGLFMVLPLLALYAADLPGATSFSIGIALGAYGLTQAILQIPLGWLSDRVGRRRVIVAGLVMFTLGSVIAAQADTMGDIILGRVLQGAGAIASTVLALVADLTREEQRTKAMALVGVSIGMSFAVSLVLGPLVASVGGLAAVFWFSALLAILGMLIVVVWVPSASGALAAAAPSGPPESAAGDLPQDGSKGPRLGALNFGVFSLHFILMASFLVIPGLLETDADIAREGHWMVYLPVMLLSLVGMVPVMVLSERFNRPRQAFYLSAGALMLALLILAFNHDRQLLFVAMWLFFVGFNYLEATLPSQVSKVARPGGKGAAMGMFSTCQFLGAFCGGAAGGWLLQYWATGALLAACVGLVALWALVESRQALAPVALDESTVGRA